MQTVDIVDGDGNDGVNVLVNRYIFW
jgi:hypothetical protein